MQNCQVIRLLGFCFDVLIMASYKSTWKAKCPIFKAIVAGFRGKVALKK